MYLNIYFLNILFYLEEELPVSVSFCPNSFFPLFFLFCAAFSSACYRYVEHVQVDPAVLWCFYLYVHMYFHT